MIEEEPRTNTPTMTTDPHDADELSNRLHAGDDSVLGDVFAQAWPRLLRTVQLRLDPRLRGRVDPEDVMQDAYLAASQRLDHYRNGDFDRCFVWLRAMLSVRSSDSLMLASAQS